MQEHYTTYTVHIITRDTPEFQVGVLNTGVAAQELM